MRADVVSTPAQDQKALAALVNLAHELGWNGVENSKILSTFLRCHVEDLEARCDQLYDACKKAEKLIAQKQDLRSKQAVAVLRRVL